jgi:NitT/TauT family transport system permease protein
MPRSKAGKVFLGVGIAVFWLAVWQIISMIVAQEILVPAPSVVAWTMWQLMGTSEFWLSSSLSLLRVVIGFLAAVIIGSIVAVLTTHFRTIAVLLTPLLRIASAAPIASFIILAMVWIRTERLPSFIAFFMVVPVVWSNVEKGIRQIDNNLLEMAKVYRFGRMKTLRRVEIPSVMPYFMAACTSGMGFAWKSGVAAEVICRPLFSIGKQLQEAKTYLETPRVFAWTITVILLSMCLEKLLIAAARRFGRQYHGSEG